MCENLVCVAITIGQLQHIEYLIPTFLDTFKWAIRPVFPETVTYYILLLYVVIFYKNVATTMSNLLNEANKESFLQPQNVSVICSVLYKCFMNTASSLSFFLKVYIFIGHMY